MEPLEELFVNSEVIVRDKGGRSLHYSELIRLSCRDFCLKGYTLEIFGGGIEVSANDDKVRFTPPEKEFLGFEINSMAKASALMVICNVYGLMTFVGDTFY